MSLKQPIGQKRLTNIAVVRLKTQGLRFEVACYRNTVVAWRNKIEKDLDNVLQSTTIYSNVSKGVLANKEELQKVFGTTDKDKICVLILERGELQVSDLERRSSAETLARDVVQVLVDKCVNPATGRPYTAGVLERALKTAHVALDPKRSAKQQALEALPRLQAQFPIERARMRFRIAAPAAAAEALRAALAEQNALVESEDTRNETFVVTCTADPGSYRAFHAFTRSEACLGAGRMEVLSLAVADSAGTLEGEDSLPLPHVPPAEIQAVRLDAGDALTHELAQASLVSKPAARAGGSSMGTTLTSAPAAAGSSGSATVIIFPRAPIASLPEAHASRRERFAELDTLSPGWLVELRSRPGSTVVDAVFYAPDGTEFKSFADARRVALKARVPAQ